MSITIKAKTRDSTALFDINSMYTPTNASIETILATAKII